MIRQYRPLLGAAIALLATGVVAGELTLYEGENFQGRNLTLRSDMRDLDRTQFNDRAMSLVIRDGVWEVCSDAQFRGHCATLQPGNYVAVCFVPDAKTGKPHYMLGMISSFTVA